MSIAFYTIGKGTKKKKVHKFFFGFKGFSYKRLKVLIGKKHEIKGKIHIRRVVT
jgi:hypothetical protein